jgi:hypothetical protein
VGLTFELIIGPGGGDPIGFSDLFCWWFLLTVIRVYPKNFTEGLILGQPFTTTAGQRLCARLVFQLKAASRRTNVQRTQSVPSLFLLIVPQGRNQAATRT